MNRFPNLNDYTKMNSMIMKLNMNINTSVAAIYAMMLLLVACSQERTLFPTEKTDRVPLSVFTSFKADVTTRATAQPLPEGSSIGVFLIADANLFLNLRTVKLCSLMFCFNQTVHCIHTVLHLIIDHNVIILINMRCFSTCLGKP